MKNNKSLLVATIGLMVASYTGNSVAQEQEITLEKIMSDPRWIANSPQAARWLPNSEQVVFKQNQSKGELQDTLLLDVNTSEANKVALSELHKVAQSSLVYNRDKTKAAYVFEGDLYLLDIATNKLTQLTRTSAKEEAPQFLNNGSLAYWIGSTAFNMNLDSKLVSELAKLVMTDQQNGVEEPGDLVAQEQHDLIDYVAKVHQDAKDSFNYRKTLQQNNKAMAEQPFYMGTGQRLIEAALSPTAKYMFVVTEAALPWRGENDLMPSYIGQDGRIQFEEVRERVADAEPNQQDFWLIDLTDRSMEKLSITDLPDYNKDVLKKVKAENAKEQGKKYKSKKETRTINLMVDWTWSQSPVQWHNNGEQLAVMLEAWDNKDRWIATVDVEKDEFVNQHQLHDDAWINYTFNDFGWFNNSEKLYFLSEQSGYSHIYTKSLDSSRVKQVTKGKYEVSELYLTEDDSKFVFRANVEHPGNYQAYLVNSKAKKVTKPTAITSLKGNNRFVVSPDESKLLVTHSNLLTPDELYLVDLKPNAQAKRLTNTVTEEFMSMPWVKPEVIEVESSYSDQPIYAKVYYPKDYKQGEKRRAVIFNHGAGYLQNSDFGFSGYFREFMFHSLLAQQGYVVMDMDYRASMGYGRDWRTAIYRQMGTPEVQDLRDGVNWLVENANVDRERIGTYGGSYGGFMTFMALFTQPDLFQAGAALRPVSDWAHYNDGYTSNILNRPQDDMIAYRRSSPIYFAEGLEKPLLINAPMIDDNVFFLDVVRLVQRMIELEKENFETAIYPVEAHGFKQPSSWLDEYRRIYKLFENNL